MITQLQSGETIVGCLRIEGAKVDPTLAQLRLSTLLNNAISHPNTLPPTAIVLIRKLRDPLPGSLRLGQHDIQPPAAWRQALTATLDRLAGSAVRPALGAVPANAEAVVFWDRSELLACLATDWCHGVLTARWWWRSFLKKTDARQAVLKAWQDSPEYIPAAVARLANTQTATAFVDKLTDGEVSLLFQVVARSFGLAGFAPDLSQSPDTSSTSITVATTTEDIERGNKDQRGTETFVRAPWCKWATEIDPQLRPLQQQFLGIALMLRRAPAVVRSSGFVNDVKQWAREIQSYRGNHGALDVIERSKREAEPVASQKEEPGVHATQSSRQPQSEATRKAREEGLMLSGDSARSDPSAAPIDFPTGPGYSLLDHLSPPSSSGAAGELIQDSIPAAVVLKTEVGSEPEPTASPSFAIVEPVDFATLETQTTTEFGGLFYLINLAIYLDLYGDFSAPAQPGIALNIWDFVLLAGETLLGKRLQKDPLRNLLAALAQRNEDDEPGQDFEPDDEWRSPPEWLKPFPQKQTLYWSGVDGRLRVSHPEGFLVVDVPLTTGDPAEQVKRELRSYKGFEFSLRKSKAARAGNKSHTKLDKQISNLSTSVAIKRWLRWLMPYVRARLQRALGLNKHKDPAPLLCQQRAKVGVTATHVDVVFALEQLPIQIRFARLDRDPGWVPAAGKFIAFHFE